MPTLYMKSSCTTCRRAKAVLAELGVEVVARDYFRKPLEAAELEALLPEDPMPFMGNKSPKFKELGLQHRRLTKAEAVALIVEDNNLLKRPLLVHQGGAVIGLDEGAYRRLEGTRV